MGSFDSRVVGWEAYYADRSTVRSEDALGPTGQKEWKAAPSDGLILVVLFFGQMRRPDENYRRTMSGSDYFWRAETPGGVIYAHGNALDPSIPATPGEGQVKAGKWVSDSDYRAIHDAAHSNRSWLSK